VEVYNIHKLHKSRAGQRSFHVVADRDVRIEFHNMRAGEKLGRFRYDGALVVSCFAGAFVLCAGSQSTKLASMDQAVMAVNEAVELECTDDGFVQFIWSPPHATTATE
jgi:hypothetical protein